MLKQNFDALHFTTKDYLCSLFYSIWYIEGEHIGWMTESNLLNSGCIQNQSPLVLHNVFSKQVFTLTRALCFSACSLSIFSNSKLNISNVDTQGLGRSSFHGAWHVVLEVSVIQIGNQEFHWSLSFYVCPCSLF